MKERMTATEIMKRQAEWKARPPTPIEIELMDKLWALVIKRERKRLFGKTEEEENV